MKHWVILILSSIWIVLAPIAGFWGILLGMIDGTCAHWTLMAAQDIWLLAGPVYLICGLMALMFYKGNKYKSALKTTLSPIIVVILQLLTYPFLDSPIRDCGLY